LRSKAQIPIRSAKKLCKYPATLLGETVSVLVRPLLTSIQNVEATNEQATRQGP
jgi:hypothetical protein